MTPRPTATEPGLLRGTPIREHQPEFSDDDYAGIARVLDEMRAARAQRLLHGGDHDVA